jgi:hypothetical protein
MMATLGFATHVNHLLSGFFGSFVMTLIEIKELTEGLFPFPQSNCPSMQNLLSLGSNTIDPLRRPYSLCIPLRLHPSFILHVSKISINGSYIRWVVMETEFCYSFDELISVRILFLQGKKNKRLK